MMTIDTRQPYRLIGGKCEQVLPTLPENFFHSIGTDPPYHLGDPRPMTRAYPQRDKDGVWDDAGRQRAQSAAGFMGMKWDGGDIAFDPATWAECLRVLRPGGYMFSFGGPRTYHRVATAIEDAGFILRDTVNWLHGSGFPKSLNVERAIAVKTCRLPGRHFANVIPKDSRPGDHVCPVTPESSPWAGYGTALKPAHEPIIIAQKPFKGTYVKNLLEWGTGALNIDGSRLATSDNLNGGAYAKEGDDRYDGYENWRYKRLGGAGEFAQPDGRWPANVVLTHSIDCAEHGCAEDCPLKMIDSQSGVRKSGAMDGTYKGFGTQGIFGEGGFSPRKVEASEGGASRYYTVTQWDFEHDLVPFFYSAKASRAERELGLDHLEVKSAGEMTMRQDGQKGLENPRAGAGRTSGARNFHPTVKPLSLIRWLTKLVTPAGGTTLDPFAGSGTGTVAAILEGFEATAIEMTAEYWPIIKGRADHHLRGK